MNEFQALQSARERSEQELGRAVKAITQPINLIDPEVETTSITGSYMLPDGSEAVIARVIGKNRDLIARALRDTCNETLKGFRG